MMKRWSELFPMGRTVFYEGDDHDGFAAEMRRRYRIDVKGEGWNERRGWSFHCPARCLDAVYGSGRYRIGS